MTMLPVPGNLLEPSRYPVRSSEWWIDLLSKALHNRLARFTKLDEYYRGEQSLQNLAGSAWFESELGRMFPDYLHANHSKLIVNAAAQRLVVQGFRFGGELEADTEASRIWLANDMDAMSDKAHTESLVKGECPVLVEPNPLDERTPVITPQTPNEVIVWHSAGDSRIRLAALKTWWEDDARRRYYILYLPDRIEHWQDRETGQMDRWMEYLLGIGSRQWEHRDRRDVPWQLPNPLGEVPVVVLPNDPRLAGSPEGEHEPVLSRIDHYNKTLMDMAVTSHEMAFPQRWGAGVEAEESSEEEQLDPITGEPVALPPQPQVRTGQTRWVTTPAPDASFGQFAVAQLDNYVKELEQIRADIATDTFTPYHFLLNMPTSVPPSGESIDASETPLTDKVFGHQRDKGSGWRQVMRLAFRIAGDESRAEAMRAGKVIWQDPRRRTESQHVDALGKMRQMLEMPLQAVWEMLPAAPEDIERWKKLKEAEPPPPAPVAASPGLVLPNDALPTNGGGA